MKEYILIIILFLIIIIFLVNSKKSNYNASTSVADWHVTFFQVGKDINRQVTMTVASTDNSLSVDAINSNLWTDSTKSTYWGFRKVLQVGGGGAVSYLPFADDTAATAALTQQAGGLQSYNYNGIEYLIPNIVIVKKSKVSPIFSCLSNQILIGSTVCIYDDPIKKIARGSDHVCVLRENTVYSQGSNTFGQLGIQDWVYFYYHGYGYVSTTFKVVQIAAGSNHTVALISDGTVYCWGLNSSGQLGDGTLTNHNTPTLVPGLTNVINVECGSNHTCALTSDGSIYCWGSNSKGQIGVGDHGNQFSPVLVSSLSSISKIFCGPETTSAISYGTVFSWGLNSNRQLGTGTTTNSNIPAYTVIVYEPKQISYGSSHTCAILSDGSLLCWGNNSYGQLGDGNGSSSAGVPALTNVLQIDCGANSTCALLENGSVYCWGQINNSFTPQLVSFIYPIVAVSCRNNTIIVSTTNSTVKNMSWSGSGYPVPIL